MPNLRDLDIGVGGSGRPSSWVGVATRETNAAPSRLRGSWLGMDLVRLAPKSGAKRTYQYRRDGPFAEVIGSTGQCPVYACWLTRFTGGKTLADSRRPRDGASRDRSLDKPTRSFFGSTPWTVAERTRPGLLLGWSPVSRLSPARRRSPPARRGLCRHGPLRHHGPTAPETAFSVAGSAEGWSQKVGVGPCT